MCENSEAVYASTAKIVEIKNLNYTYPDGTRALEDISLDIYEGESVAIVGPNGAGKSTLLLTLTGILQAEGDIKVLGLPVEPKNLRQIRSKVGQVFQNPDDQLFCPRVFDDVAFGPLNQGLSDTEVEARVRTALSLVGMTGYEKRLSHHLSHGEKKRIALACVLSMNPSIIFLDEPFSGLDLRGKRGLLGVLRSLCIPKIIVTHDLDIVCDLCHRIFILDGRRLVASGRTSEILKSPDLLEAHGVEHRQIMGCDMRGRVCGRVDFARG